MGSSLVETRQGVESRDWLEEVEWEIFFKVVVFCLLEDEWWCWLRKMDDGGGKFERNRGKVVGLAQEESYL